MDGIDLMPVDEGDDNDGCDGDVAVRSTKRVRKERIVMVDGKGSGYGGSIPMLAETMDKPFSAEEADVVPHRRSRAWTHMSFCCLCGRVHKLPPDEHTHGSKGGRRKRAIVVEQEVASLRCSFCPMTFHETCLGADMGSRQG